MAKIASIFSWTYYSLNPWQQLIYQIFWRLTLRSCAGIYLCKAKRIEVKSVFFFTNSTPMSVKYKLSLCIRIFKTCKQRCFRQTTITHELFVFYSRHVQLYTFMKIKYKFYLFTNLNNNLSWTYNDLSLTTFKDKLYKNHSHRVV